MKESAIKIGEKRKSVFLDKVKEILPNEGNLNACLTCGMCASGCPATGIDDMDPRKFLRMAVMGLDEEILTSPWVWACTMCQRCNYVCPMDINIPQLIYNARASWPRDERPKGIRGSCDTAMKVDSCSAMGLTSEMFIDTVTELVEEVREEQEGMENLQAPIDKKGAHFLINQNSREPQMEEDEMVPLWKIMKTVDADWTYGSRGWAAENYCMFLGDDEAWEKNVRIKAGMMEELGCKVWLNTEWGHELFAFRSGLQKFNIDYDFEIADIRQYYAKWIREGKLQVNSDWNKDLNIKFTLQDPCQLVRKTFGDEAAEDMRYVTKKLVGEENFIDMTPNRSNNYCCGGGGGFLQSGRKEERRTYGKLKDEQIKATGATYVIAPCHNCHSQIHDLSEHFGGGYHVIHFWTLICLSMGILGENERVHLGPDLQEFGLD